VSQEAGISQAAGYAAGQSRADISAPRGGLALAIRFAIREMRGGLSGFFIFLACIALGVAAIGGVNSVAQAISIGVQSQGQVLLGGDIRFRLIHREVDAAERAFIDGLGGEVSASAGLRSMVRLEDGSDQTLVEVKAVDEAYPLYGEAVVASEVPLQDLFGERDGAYGAVAPQLLFDRLGLEPGERVRLGNGVFELRAELLSEPDAISDGFSLAPRLMVSLEALRAAGLLQHGSLVEHLYKVRMPEGTSDAAINAIRSNANRAFPEAGWTVRGRSNAAPALTSNIERFSQFLTLVGLTALVVGGVGVANAVRAYLDSKRGVIATFKSLGAPGRLIFAIYLAQILLIAAIAVAVGLVLAALMPFATAAFLADLLPVPAHGGLYPGALALAALFGFLVTLAFAILPLGRARDVPLFVASLPIFSVEDTSDGSGVRFALAAIKGVGQAAMEALVAERDVLVVISNCPQVFNPCNGWTPTPIRVIAWG
jgi:putative ABC transport system permease protein